MAITPLPSAPEPTDSTAQFNTKAFAWVASLDDFVTETNATAVQVTALEESAELSATASANSATASDNSASASAISANASATSAETAAAATNAVLWVSGTTYAIGFLVYSPLDKRAYRRLTAGAGTTDPSLDATNWSQLTRVVEQTDIGTAPNEIPLNQYLGSMAYLQADNIAFSATGTNAIEQNLAINKLSTVVISADTTVTTTVPKVTASAYVIVITSGTTSRTVTFGTGFKSTGTLATGTSADRRFVFHFISDGTNLVEVSRTAAITY